MDPGVVAVAPVANDAPAAAANAAVAPNIAQTTKPAGGTVSAKSTELPILSSDGIALFAAVELGGELEEGSVRFLLAGGRPANLAKATTKKELRLVHVLSITAAGVATMKKGNFEDADTFSTQRGGSFRTEEGTVILVGGTKSCFGFGCGQNSNREVHLITKGEAPRRGSRPRRRRTTRATPS